MAVSFRTDEEFQRDVLAELRWNSYVKQWTAQQAAHRVHDVKAVTNDLKVHLPGSAKCTDANLVAAVLNAFMSRQADWLPQSVRVG
jgi:hypothetical protein